LTFTNLSHNEATHITIQLRIATLPSVTSSPIAISPAPVSRLVFATQPGSATAGLPFGVQPALKTQDQFGNNSTSGLAATLNLTLSLSSGVGPLQGSTNLDIGANAGNGMVAFSDLRLDHAGTNNQLSASASGLSNALSSPFAVSPAAASNLTISISPSSNAVAGVVFSTQPVVRVEDLFGNLRSGDYSTVVTATRAAGSGALQGTTNLTAIAGLVSFADLAHNIATNITISFSSPGLAGATSASVVVSPGAFSKLQLLAPGETAAPGTVSGKSGTPNPQSAGSAFSVTVNAVDPYWNIVNTNDTVAITSSDPNAALPT